MRTQEEIQKQIEGLESMKTKLPEFSAFGTPNWEMFDMQISILDGSVDFEDLEEDEDLLDEGEPDEVYNAAQEAQYWLDGYSDDDLYE